MRTVPIHNLRPNETTWTPPVIACFDTETRSAWVGTTEEHELRCWAARLVVRRDKRKTIERAAADEGVFASDFAQTLDAWANRHTSLWVYAHNLAFDLTTSAVTTHLAGLGWSVTEFAIDSPSPFVRMTNGRSRITFSDSFSWLPGKLEEVAARLGKAKVPLPANDGDLPDWLERCRVDVDILTNAMLEIMDWWDGSGLGRWSVTGSASGWNVMRHKIDAKRFTINPDPKGIESDRAAIYGGRRGLWRYGHLKPGSYAELDFTSAYPVIAANCPLPLERMASFTSLPLGHRWLTSDRHGVIARVRLQADTPRWPARIGRRVWYPVGDFWTTLAGPDIREAMELGCLKEIGAGYVHRLGYALKPWADWVLRTARPETSGAPETVRMWAKHCGRAVIGKWAQRGFDTMELGPAPTQGWWATEGWNHTRGVRAVIIDFDGRRWQASASGDGDNCYPAVLAWVESYVRVRLGRLIESLPDGSVMACDTDGLIVDLTRMGDHDFSLDSLAPLVPRVKNKYTTAKLIGPQHMILDGTQRFAGIPSGAKPSGDGRVTAQLWPKMIWQMGNSEPGTYRRPQQPYRIAGTYAPGWVLADNRVIPITTYIDDEGNNRIIPWDLTGWQSMGISLGETQNDALRGYIHGKDT